MLPWVGVPGSLNPFEAPTVDAALPADERSIEEQTRRAHLPTESRLRSISALFVIAALGALGVGFVRSSRGVRSGEVEELLAGLAFCAVGVVVLMTAVGLWRIDRRARFVAVALALPLLIQPPVLTALAVYIMFILLSKKGETVFSEAYAAVIAATPDIRLTSGPIARGILAVLAGVLAWLLYQELSR